ncbi:MAG: FHA domain-containing protein [Gammaproteobacteria bacterium]|nr:FHA domain-containing protein [Gammaproteobacteria bacterium]MCW8922458.1 FHA domain-containing protein [Gammaproteobacteria bacterium]
MAKLILSFDNKPLKEYELDQEIITIGRKPNNDIHIDNLAVSGTHAKVLTILNDSFIEDLNSTNGTLINGKPITKHSLKNGEKIIIGKHTLEYVNEAEEAGEGEFEKTMIIRPDTNDQPVSSETSKKLEKSIGKIAADLASAGAAGASEQTEASLELLSGANSGKRMKITKILTTLGKPGVQVAAITRRPLGFFLIVVDAGSYEKRPLVNDQEVGTQAHPLNDKDIIEVAGVRMGFYLE